MHAIFKISTLALLLSACQTTQPRKTGALQTNWQLIPDQSTFSFVTTKNKTAMEEHSIQFQDGSISDQKFTVKLDLNSVDTLIPIRDQRLRDILFETETHPVATITHSLTRDLTFNQTIKMPFTLHLHGKKMDLAAKVIIQMIDQQMVVVNYEPILVNAKDFGLDAAINQLTKIAGLQSINYEVLVDFKLTFES